MKFRDTAMLAGATSLLIGCGVAWLCDATTTAAVRNVPDAEAAQLVGGACADLDVPDFVNCEQVPGFPCPTIASKLKPGAHKINVIVCGTSECGTMFDVSNKVCDG